MELVTYSDFCNRFYIRSNKAILTGAATQPAIAEFFFSMATGNKPLYGHDDFRKWFTGERKPRAEYWEDVKKAFSEDDFTKKLQDSIISIRLPDVMRNFGIEIATTDSRDSEAFARALARQLYALACGNGEADDTVSRDYFMIVNGKQFPTYFSKTIDKYGKMKTILYPDEVRPIESFYVCNDIEFRPKNNTKKRRVIKNITLPKLYERAPYSILTGVTGIGKSMMLRHLFVDAAKRGAAKGLPVLINLLEYGKQETKILALLIRVVRRFDKSITKNDIVGLLEKGAVMLLLDGLDEVKKDLLDQFFAELEIFIDEFAGNQVVITSRSFSSFITLTRFTTFDVVPFDEQQSLRMIDNITYCSEEPTLKDLFKQQLNAEYFRTHKEFTSNPLLLTLMLIVFRKYRSVPQNKYIFYEEAYDMLLQGHDANNNLGYRREFSFADDPADFTAFFRELCERSYRNSQFAFDQLTLKYYFTEVLDAYKQRVSLTAFRKQSKKMTFKNFITDATINTSFMTADEDVDRYQFLHRSVQEYYFADYYREADDDAFCQLGLFLRDKFQSTFDDGNAFQMLFEMRKGKVERFIFLPYLKDLLEAEDEDAAYGRFLCEVVSTFKISVFYENEINRVQMAHGGVKVDKPKLVWDYNDTKSCIMSWIIQANNKGRRQQLRAVADSENLYDQSIQEYPLFGRICEDQRTKKEIFNVGVNLGEDALQNSNLDERAADGKRIVFGRICFISMESIFSNPDKYPELLEYLHTRDFPLYKTFQWLTGYYRDLKKRYVDAGTIDTSF